MKFAKRKVRLWTLKSKDDNKITKKAVPLKTWGSLEAANTLSRGAFLLKCKVKFRKKRESGENFLQRELSIYRGEGGSFKNSPRFDRCEVSVGCVSTPTFRGWRFFTEIQRFSWNQIVGVNPLPRGVSPSKHRVWRIRNSWNEFSGWLTLRRSGILNLRSPEVANLRRSGILNPQSPEVANLWRSGILNLRSPEVVDLWRSGILNLQSPEVANLWGHGVMNLRNSEIGNLWN
jgi:hypothetical protein